MAHARVYTDYVIERFAPYFSRLAPTAAIPITDVDDAVVQIERVAAAGFRAILLPATPPKPYYSRDFDPVWAATQTNGAQALFHTQTVGVKVNDPASSTLKVVMDSAAQVNKPMTEASASKQDGDAVRVRRVRPREAHLQAGRRHGQVLGHRHRTGSRLVDRDVGRHSPAQ